MFEQRGGAADAGAQGVELGAGGGLVGVWREAFGLQGERGHRGAQFVRGVGDEAFFAAQGGVDAREQAVGGVDDAAHFLWHAVSGERREVVFGAGFDVVRQAAHRSQGAVDGVEAGQCEDGHEQEQRQDGVPGAGAGDLVAAFGVLDEG